jgi:hypothetical protein
MAEPSFRAVLTMTAALEAGNSPAMKTLLCWLASAAPLLAIPASTTLTLVNEPNFNRITVTVDPQVGLNVSDTETTTLTGIVTAQLDIDPQAGTTTELTLTNGRANGTNMTFSRTIPFVGGYTITVSDLSAAIYTINPPGAVTPATGQFAANQHQFVIDQGTISGSTNGLIGNNTINEAFTPETPASGTGTGTGTVTLTATGDSGIYRTFNVVATLPVSISDTFVAGTTTVNITASGTVKASGTVQVPRTPYLAWTVDQGIPGAAFGSEAAGGGLPLGVLWALGLDAGDDGRPHLPRTDPLDPKGFLLSLPPTGTAAPLVLEQSDDLFTWTNVPTAAVSAAANPLPAGTAGTVVIAADGSAARFVRVRATEP